MYSSLRAKATAVFAAFSLFALAGCATHAETPSQSEQPAVEQSPTESTTPTPTADTTDAFPMSFANADGTVTEIPAKPEHIVSTSVTLTGMAIPFKAPIVASAAAANGDFFPAWKKPAEEMNIEKLWKAQSPANLEAITAAKPDLILVSVTGADSVKDQLAELQQIAPTVLIDYSKSSWQEVTKQLGQVSGMSEAAEQVIEDFNKQVSELANKIKHPEGQVSIVSFNGNAKPNAIAQTGGPYGELFTALGFDVEEPNKDWNTGNQEGGKRTDFVFTSIEHLTELQAKTIFLIHADQETADQMLADPLLANMPAVQAKQIYPLGKPVFRLDYYTSQIALKTIKELYDN